MRASCRVLIAAALVAWLPGAAHAQGTPPAACTSFSDDSLPAGTPIKAIHVTQLRMCIDAWRINAGLPGFAWTDPTLTPTATTIRTVHVTQLRDALAAVYSAYGRHAPYYSDGSLIPGVTEIRRAQIAELRAYARFNGPPIITGPSNQTNAEQSTVAVAISASDAERSALFYGATGLPPGLAVNSATGVISGTISAGTRGTYFVTVSASDGFTTATRSLTWTIKVNHPPSISGPSRETMFEGASVSVPIAASDPDGGAVTFAATGLPPGLAINATTGLIAGTLGIGSFGHFFPVVSASNGQAFATLTIPWTVIGAADSYVYDSFTGTDGTALRSHVPDKHGDFGNAWRYGAGAAGQPSLQSDTIRLTTDSGLSVWQLFGGSYDAIVAADISSAASAPYGGLALRIVDSNNYFVLTVPGPSLYRVVQGQWTLIGQPATPQTVAPGHEYRLEARLIDQQVQVFWNGALLYYVNDSTNQDATHHGLVFDTSHDATFRLDNFEISALNHAPALDAPDEQLHIEGASVSLQVVGSDSEGTPLTYAATGLPPGLSINPATGTIAGLLAYGSAGTYAVGITASDGEAIASRGFTWRVLAPSATLIFDTFNTANAEYLPNHRFTIGPSALSWHWLRGLYFPRVVDGAVHTELSPRTEAWTANVGLADVTLAVDVHSTDLTPYGGLILRASNASNYLFLRYDGPYLYRYVNGDYQELGEAHVPFNQGETHRLAVRAVGDRIDVYSDGVLLFSRTETFNRTATRHGLLWDPLEDSGLTFDNFELRSDQAIAAIPAEPPACDFAVSPLTMSVSNDKGTYGVDVSSGPPGCVLSVHADSDAFIEEGPVYVTNTGFRVTFSIQNNTDPHPRIGYLAVGGHTVTITQAGGSGCRYMVSPTAPLFSAAGNNGTVTVSANCDWTVVSQSPFVHVTGTNVHSNAGTISYIVDANPDATQRVGVLQIDDQQVVVTQLGSGQTEPGADPDPAPPPPPGDPDPSGCTYFLLPVDATFDANAHTAAVSVFTSSHCGWTASVADDFVRITNGASGSGNGVVNYTVDANEGHEGRVASATIAGWPSGVLQLGQGGEPLCIADVSPESWSIDSAGGGGHVDVQAAAGCEWTIEAQVPWISFDTMSGVGDRTVAFAATANPGTDGRAATVLVAAHEMTLTQEGALPGIIFPDGPDSRQVGGCHGNCGRDCSSFFKPSCINATYGWTRTQLSEPQYVGDEQRPVCQNGHLGWEVYRRYVAYMRWTFHGVSTLACAEHDFQCRESWLGHIPIIGVLYCVKKIVDVIPPLYCSGQAAREWSYEVLAPGRSRLPDEFVPDDSVACSRDPRDADGRFR